MTEKNVNELTESFGFLFLLSRRFEYLTDQALAKDGLTTKQLLTLIVIEREFHSPPSISQIAEVLSTTHQNIKKIAQQLEKKEFIEILRDKRDRRRLLLKTTQKNKDYWNSRSLEHLQEIQNLFSSLSAQEIHDFHRLVKKLVKNTEIIHSNARGLSG